MKTFKYLVCLCAVCFLGCNASPTTQNEPEDKPKKIEEKKSQIVFMDRVNNNLVVSETFEFKDKNGNVHVILVTSLNNASGIAVSTLEINTQKKEN